MQHKDKTLSQSWIECGKMTRQTTIHSFLPKFRLDREDILVAFCGRTAYGDL